MIGKDGYVKAQKSSGEYNILAPGESLEHILSQTMPETSDTDDETLQDVASEQETAREIPA